MTRKYQLGSPVRKKGLKGQWRGWVVGFYHAKHTPIGYAVESALEPGSVQIYPEDSLEDWGGGRNDGSRESYLENLYHRTSAKVSRMEIEHKRRVNELLESNNALLGRARDAEDKLKEFIEKEKDDETLKTFSEMFPQCKHQWGIGKKAGSLLHRVQCHRCLIFQEDTEPPTSPVKTYEDGYLDGYNEGVDDGFKLTKRHLKAKE